MSFLGALLACAGGAFMVIAGVGIVRMNDVYQRLHCSAKSASLGVVLVLLGSAAAASDPAVSWRCLAASIFFLITAPVGCHVLARAAYRAGVPLAANTLSDAWGVDTPGQPVSDAPVAAPLATPEPSSDPNVGQR